MRNATIHERNIRDRERKIVFGVIYAYAVATLRRECVLIQKLKWRHYDMNVYQVEQIVLLPLLVCFYNGMNLNL
jgi:hypothetical protein